MIESIQIANVATYDKQPQVLSELSKINFLYGSNGSGKTTVTRVIAEETNFPTCAIKWKGGTKLRTMVYNRDFVIKNFNPSTELRGIFTLGEKDIEISKKIAAAKTELETLTKKSEALTAALYGLDGVSGKHGELATTNENFKLACWAAYTKHKAKLATAFDGVRNSKESFRDRVIQENTSNVAVLQKLEYLEEKALTVFGPAPTAELLISSVQAPKLADYETDPVLIKKVLGKDDVDIAAMIKRLGSSDWVRAGRTFYAVSEKVCPFCQQSTTSAFTKSLNDYFDEAFLADTKAIEDLFTNYTTETARIQIEINAILATPSKFLNVEKLKIEKALLDTKIALNTQKLVNKKKEPSQVVELESLGNVLLNISTLIEESNLRSIDHNTTVTNLVQEKSRLTSQVWKYICQTELATVLTTYVTDKTNQDKAISGINATITAAKEEIRVKSEEIKKLERNTTSVQPTIDAINAVLSSFGFRGFTLAKADDDICYKLIRADGSDAKETLSEGERTFITFLYFYHLLKGSNSETGLTDNRVVVFDDPVSSLDSDVLFIVSSLIKELFEELRAGTGNIKQIFVFTHNVYFHKEVTFNSRRNGNIAMKSEETFWVIRKSNSLSQLESHSTNPIKTSYELLWSEVRRPDRSNLTIQNTLRRILENYFKILGGIDLDKLNAKFSGREKLICKSLVSWVNDGSHFAHDDLYVAIDDSMIDPYLTVFRAIFENSDHGAHYKMMMGDAYVEKPSALINSAVPAVPA